MYAIGIDIGTTSICGVVLDIDTGKVIKSRTEMSNAFITTSNSWEKMQDTNKVIDLAIEILESFSEYPAAVIGVTGQMHGIVYVDCEGKAVSPLYTWQDARGNLPYRDTTYADYLGSFSGYGNVTDFYNRINHIRPAEAVSHCTIMDYLVMVLCGLKTPKIHTTNAASLGCFDLKEKRFSYDINAEISDSFEIAGYYKNIPVSVAIGDNQASVFSTLADERDLLINVGTGSQISVISDQIRTGENIETRPYFDGKYLVVGAALCGGRAYGMLKDFYTEFLQAAGVSVPDVYAVMNRMLAGHAEEARRAESAGHAEEARRVESAGHAEAARHTESAGHAEAARHLKSALRVDTRFAGTRQNPRLRGSISEISVDNFTPENLTCGFLEGMMEELYEMYDRMGEKRINLVGSGNGIRKNKALVKIAERLFEGTLRIPAHTEEAACGAALFGLVACRAFLTAAEVQKLIRYEE
ncbi:MAG: hypothetical protein IJ390_00200 [Lachnospiraceae bacterium]|nr:hypothetical protein [Lachnospiraceae bacterium]